MDLHEQTLRLMAETDLPPTQICRDCEVTTRWFYKLKTGEIKNPGYKRLQRLHDYLAQAQPDSVAAHTSKTASAS